MFSHLTTKELAFYGVSASVGLLLLVAGVVGHARYAETLASATTSSWNFSTTTTLGGTFVEPINYPATSSPDIIRLFSVEAKKGSCGTGVIRVSWTTVGSDTTYRLYKNGTQVFEGAKTSYYDNGLPEGSTHVYMVYADTPGTTYSQIATVLGIAPSKCEVASAPGATGSTTTTTATTTGTNTTDNPNTIPVPPRVIPIATTTPVPSPATSTVPASYVPPVTYTPPVPVSNPAPVTNPPVTAAPAPETVPTPAPTPRPVVDLPQPLVQDIERTLALPTTSPSTERTRLSTTTEAKVAKLFTVVSVFDETDKARQQARRALVAFVDDKIRAAFATMNDEQRTAKKESLEQLRASVLAHIDERLAAGTDVRAQATALTAEITERMSVLSEYGVTTDSASVGTLVDSAVAPLTAAADEEQKALKEQGGDLLYKDTNKDGISDYDSVHVYNIDPVKPSPTSVYKGKKITAGEKVALGFDPAQAKLVQVTPEEPERSSAPVARSYQVSSVALTEEKKVALTGRALPNSFVTLYIYSTPVVVTVKTDANGSWKYTLNKELEDGSHSVSVATVDNSGKILAKSSPIPFTKTAQAATLDSASTSFISDAGQPTLFSGRTLYMLIMVCAGIIFFTLGIMGLNTRRQEETPTAA
jgi:hypothetical protein